MGCAQPHPLCLLGSEKMIDEEATFKRFGYYPTDLSPKSCKKIVAICDGCGKVRVVMIFAYCTLCVACAQKGENNSNWQGGLVKRICKQCGIEFPVNTSDIKRGGSKFCSRKCKDKRTSEHLSGENSHMFGRKGENCPAWKGGISFEPYCNKFNNKFKEYIRDKFGRVCFLCPKTEEENGQRLSVHHVNYNKNCGCDEDETCQFVPLCRNCNVKVNANRPDWEPKIKAEMRNKLNGWYI